MIDDPLVSIIIPCYNYGKYVLSAIESALSSNYLNIEVIVVDDGSTDPETLKILRDFDKTRDKVTIYFTQNHGVGAARNFAVSKARGKYILSLDADNQILPDYVPKAVEVLEKFPNIVMVHADATFFGDRQGLRQSAQLEISRFLIGNYIDNCAVFRKDCCDKVGGYPIEKSLSAYEDYIFWLKILLSGGEFHHIPEVQWKYHVKEDSLSFISGKNQKKIALIHKYLYPIKVNLLEQTILNHQLSRKQSLKILGEIQHQLAYYSLNYMNFLSGLSLAFRSSLNYPPKTLVNLKIIITASLKKNISFFTRTKYRQ